MAHPRSTITLAAVIASIAASCGAPANVTPSPDSPAGDDDGSVTVVDTSYAGDPDPALQNPERGMYFGGMPGAAEFHTIVPEWLWLDTVCGQNLTWNGYHQAGTSAILDAYADKLETYRAHGVKVLFRPRYDRPSDNGPSGCQINGSFVFHADSKTRQYNHIDAIAAMLGDYKDVIAFIQAGYLGRWGEWNTAGYATANAPLLYSYADRSDIMDHVLAAYAAANVVQDVELRRPLFAREIIDRNATANVALHNDCFMTSDSDSGTYSDLPGSPANFGSSAAAKAWAQAFTADASFGGETCPLTTDPSDALYHTERWRSCSNMTSELATLHMDYINGDYANDAVSTWTTGGCYDEIRRKLGYRFEVTRVEYTPTVAAGRSFTVLVDVANTGWAKLLRPRTAQLVLRSGSTASNYAPTNGATADWAPGTTTQLSLAGTAPTTPGTYSVRLWIPDPDAESRFPYAVKLASLRGDVNGFDASTGENDLGVTINVQ